MEKIGRFLKIKRFLVVLSIWPWSLHCIKIDAIPVLSCSGLFSTTDVIPVILVIMVRARILKNASTLWQNVA